MGLAVFAEGARTTLGAAAKVKEIVAESRTAASATATSRAHVAAANAEHYSNNIVHGVGEGLKTIASATSKVLLAVELVPVVGQAAAVVGQVPAHILASAAYGTGALVQAGNAALHGNLKDAGRRVVGGIAGAGVNLVPGMELGDGAKMVYGAVAKGATMDTVGQSVDNWVREKLGEGVSAANDEKFKTLANTANLKPTGSVMGVEHVKGDAVAQDLPKAPVSPSTAKRG